MQLCQQEVKVVYLILYKVEAESDVILNTVGRLVGRDLVINKNNRTVHPWHQCALCSVPGVEAAVSSASGVVSGIGTVTVACAPHSVFNWIKDNDYDFALLQETHCSTDFEAKIWSSQWNRNAFWNNGDSNSKGVAILVNKKVSYVCVENISHMIKGRFQTININVDADKTFTISNVYAPNNTVDKKIFFTEINKAIQNEKHIIGGVFNCTQNVTLDRKTVSIDIKEDESLPSMNQIMFDNGLEDIWRRRHPKTKMYTFNRNKSYSRIDYILTSKSIGNEVDSCTIEHFPLSDHDAISN
ncbi:YTX2-like protein [Mya arenaria]|uniref:exodeoxyribonuclease III n=1 Tax=Mya arenaria TaxID=6604 RepID=A0ABY7GBC1_MYAAR|nr:YTX2-like protein [Mya arenaria]